MSSFSDILWRRHSVAIPHADSAHRERDGEPEQKPSRRHSFSQPLSALPRVIVAKDFAQNGIRRRPSAPTQGNYGPLASRDSLVDRPESYSTNLSEFSFSSLSRFPTPPASEGGMSSTSEGAEPSPAARSSTLEYTPKIVDSGASTVDSSPTLSKFGRDGGLLNKRERFARPMMRRASWSELSTPGASGTELATLQRHSLQADPMSFSNEMDSPYGLANNRTTSIFGEPMTRVQTRTTVNRSFADGTRLKPRSIQEKIKAQFDPRFMLSLIDPRDVLLPMTPKRAAYLTGFAACIAGAVALEYQFHYAQHIVDAVRWNNLILMGFIYGIEPAMIVFVLAITTLPARRERPGAAGDIQMAYMGSHVESSALVVPCHNSDPDTITKVIAAARQHFSPEQIYIVDNGNEATPPSDMKNFVHEIHPDIQYIWSPLGNKSIAQYVGALAAKQYQHIMTIDDDVVLPENFAAPVRMLTDKIIGVSFPIQGIDTKGKKPLLVGWQDIEYKMSGLNKLAEANTCGTQFPHGAGSFWERETLIKILRLHDLVFYGEDIKLGLGAQKLGKRLTIDMSLLLDTEVPTTVLGTPPNYYQQRVRSWEMGRHLFYKEFTARLFSRNGQDTVAGFAVQKVEQMYAIASNVVDWVRLPLYAIMGNDINFWQRSAGFYFLPIAPLLYYKYIKCHKRPDLAPALTPILTYPAYKFLYSALSILGALRSTTMYWPSFRSRPKLLELEASGDSRAFWLDPRFDENPGFLAENVELETANSSATHLLNAA